MVINRRTAPVTMRDIARHCGVSQPVVSKALFGGTTSVRISQTTQAAVLAAAQELGYRPNAAARSISRRRFGRITLLQFNNRQWSYLPQAMLDGVVETLEEHHYTLAFQRCHTKDFADPEYVPGVLRESDSDGLLVNVNHRDSLRLRAMLSHHGVPAVWLNLDDAQDCVYSDDAAAAQTLTSHLLANGHRLRYFGMNVDPTTDHYSRNARLSGFHAAMAAARLPADTLLFLKGAQGNSDRRIQEALATGPATWVCYSPFEVEQLVMVALRLGLRCPHDFSLATFHPGEVAGRNFCIARMMQPLHALGRAGVTRLLTRLAAPATPLPSITVPWTLSSSLPTLP